jgi:hypothetical protein
MYTTNHMHSPTSLLYTHTLLTDHTFTFLPLNDCLCDLLHPSDMPRSARKVTGNVEGMDHYTVSEVDFWTDNQ